MSTTLRPGEPVIVRNQAKGTTRYEVEFPGVGTVEFDVLSGAQFRLVGHVPTVNIHIKDFTAGGIQPSRDKPGETGSE